MANRPVTLGVWTIEPNEAQGWIIRQPDGALRARFADSKVMAEHYAMLLEYADRMEAENEKLKRNVGILKACRGLPLDAEITDDVARKLQDETLKFLVRFAWEHGGISTGRTAELLRMHSQDLRELMAVEGWEYVTEEKTR